MQRSESIFLETSDRISAGKILCALHTRFGTDPAAVGAILGRPDGAWLSVAATAARRIPSPASIEFDGGRRGVLRRESDLRGPPGPWTITVEPTEPGAGGLARAMHGASGVAGEDLGVIRRTASGGVCVEVDRWRYRESDLPTAIAGHPTLVEKKKRKRLNKAGSAAASDRAASAIRTLLSEGANPDRVKHAIRRASRLGEGDAELLRALPRLAGTGYRASPERPAPEPGLLTLCLAMAGPEAWRTHMEQLALQPFPRDADKAASGELERLEGELRGDLDRSDPLVRELVELAAGGSLETRVAGTFAPGLRATGVSVKSPDDADRPPGTLWEAWCHVARGIASSSGVEEAELRALDLRVRAAAEVAGVELTGWEHLLAAAERENAAQGAPVYTDLEEAIPGTPRYVFAAVRAIDARVRAGRWTEGSTLASRAFRTAPSSALIARRHIRLSWRAGAAIDDDVCLVLAGEAAWREGRFDVAESAFSACGAAPGSPAATHAARRLIERGRAGTALELLGTTGPAGLRETAGVAASQWAAAAVAWAERQGDRLGLTPTPSWAKPGVLASLPRGFADALEGDIAGALERLTNREMREACLPSPDRSAANTAAGRAEDAAALVFETPEPKVPLRALAVALANEDDAPSAWHRWRGLVLHLIREISDDQWDGETVEALSFLGPIADHGELLRALPEPVVMGWLGGADVRTRAAALALLKPMRELPALIGDALGHAPARRLESATSLLAEGRHEDAAHVAQAVIRRAVDPAVRHRAAALLARTGHDAEIAGFLKPDREPGTLYDVLTALEPATLTDTLRARLGVLSSARLPERVAAEVRRLREE